MLKNDALENDTSRIRSYGSDPPGSLKTNCFLSEYGNYDICRGENTQETKLYL